MLDDKVHHGRQKHKNRYLVDGMHGTQIKIRFAIGILFAEEVGGYFLKIE
jgi:hypothetical protein